MDVIKQVIVVRDKYPDGKGGVRSIRTGKLIAQACHASMKFLVDRITDGTLEFDEVERAWMEGAFTKICVKCSSEEELVEIYKSAKGAGIVAEIITDSGKTEFGGVPTKTCLALGPTYSSVVDLITGHLKLM